MTDIAIVDDEENILKSLKVGLSLHDYSVRTFSRISTFREYLKNNEPNIVFLDLFLPDGHGLDLLPEINAISNDICVIIITAHGDIPSTVRAMKLGAFDYISKPFDMDQVEMLVAKAVKERMLKREVEHHRNRSHQKTTLDDIIGESPVMQELYKKVQRLGTVEGTTVLILGESGTGKDQLAKAIHNQSKRKKYQFIEINCAALPEQLLESELFGHERGAFTDARNKKVGLVELANGGTLFLDEIGEMPLTLQTKLLKFLETRTFRRIGGVEEIHVDLFIIASTNRNLEQSVAEKTFREDLFYRTAVITLNLPPLRERSGDADLLISHYWRVFTHKFNKPDLQLNQEVRDIMTAYDWPGNIRELRNLVEQLVILADDNGVRPDDLPKRFFKLPNTKDNQPSGLHMQSKDSNLVINEEHSLDDAVESLEFTIIKRTLQESEGNKSKAAIKLGISRYALLRKMKRLGIS